MYPHKATVKVPSTSEKDSNGNWITSGEITIVTDCRLEPNTSNKFLALSDGKRVDYAAILYMPIGSQIPAGANVKVEHGSTLLIETTVKHYHQGQLNQKVWL